MTVTVRSWIKWGVVHDKQKLNVSYYDIVPTILDLERLVKPKDLKGRSVLAC